MFCCNVTKWKIYSLLHPVVQCFTLLQKRISTIFSDSLRPTTPQGDFHFNAKSMGNLEIQEKAVNALKQKYIKPADGVSGAVFVLNGPIENTSSKKIGVYKPKESQEFCVARAVKRVFGQNSYLNEETKSEAEYSAFLLSDLLGLSITPQTMIVYADENLTEVRGSFQSFAYENASYNEKVQWLSKGNYTEKELVLFQKYALFDFLIGNLDRHLDNVFMTLKDGELIEISAIDNGNSFPNRGTRYYGLLAPPVNQYAWARFPIAEMPMCQETKDWIDSIFTTEVLDKFFESSPEFFSESMKDLFIKRFHLVASVSNREDFHLSDFLCYRYDCYINAVQV